MKYSVIIPLYNKHATIRQTVESVLKQSYPNFELIIVDDGSTDGSAEIAANFKDERIRLVRQENSGVSAARNKGMKEAAYDLIAFLDADDLWEPAYLEEMAGLIAEFPEAGMYGCAFDKVSLNSRFVDNFHLPEGFRGIIENYFRQAVGYHLFCSSAVIIRKSVVEKAGYFDVNISIGEDKDYWFRIAFHHKVAFYNKILAHYNEDAENRAMRKKHPFSKSILCYTSKYIEMEQQNPEFKYFMNHYRIIGIPELLLKYDIPKKEIRDYLDLIDPAGQILMYRIFLKLPAWIQKIIASLYLKYRGLE